MSAVLHSKQLHSNLPSGLHVLHSPPCAWALSRQTQRQRHGRAVRELVTHTSADAAPDMAASPGLSAQTTAQAPADPRIVSVAVDNTTDAEEAVEWAVQYLLRPGGLFVFTEYWLLLSKLCCRARRWQFVDSAWPPRRCTVCSSVFHDPWHRARR